MINREIIEAFAFSVPVVCALCCMVMMSMDAFTFQRDKQEKRLRLFLALTYIITSLGWLGMVLYAVAPNGFNNYLPVFLLTLMLDQVMFYRFVAIITVTGQPFRFNRLHILIPVLITAAAVLSDLFLSYDKRIFVAYEASEPLSSTVILLTTVIFIVYNTVYPLLSLRNIRRYRRFVVNYSSDAERTSLDWLFVMQILILICVPVPFAAILLDIKTFANSFFVWLGALPYFFYYIILCYNMLDNNYLIVHPDPAEEKDPVSPTSSLDRKRFERYLREKKPYLNPKLRITELAAGLNTNRSYLSAFINREYGMNFCRLINRCRLDMLDRLRIAPENADKSNMELVLMAGFSGYRNYLRVKNDEDRMKRLKFLE